MIEMTMIEVDPSVEDSNLDLLPGETLVPQLLGIVIVGNRKQSPIRSPMTFCGL
jgi:hypothetical protein